jgi:peptidoglycan/xylan/chitin deacetylase (PgdA/CDA1 family)
LSEAELAELAEGGLVEIGGHTVNHPDLATLPVQAQLQEMRTGRLHLESLVGRSVSSFSFPHGAFTDASVRLVAEAGFERSCVSVPGPVRVGADRFRLPRRHVDDWRGDEFAWHLSRFFR